MNELLQALRLPHVEAELPALFERNHLHNLTYEAFLRRVLLLEIEGHKPTAQCNHLKATHLPVRKTLEEFDFSLQPSIKSQQFWKLRTLVCANQDQHCVSQPPALEKHIFRLDLRSRRWKSATASCSPPWPI